MALARVLSKAGVRAIHAAVDDVFARLRARALGRAYGPRVIAVAVRPATSLEGVTLPAIFDAAARHQGVKPDGRLRDSMSALVGQYIDSYAERAKAHVVDAVQASLHEANSRGEDLDLRSTVHGRLATIYGAAKRDVKRLVETEATRFGNVGSLDAMTRVDVLTGGDGDPVVAFLGPNDSHTCPECQRLYFMPDGVNPRCWRTSELSAGWHQRGDDAPSMSGCHPHCRHTPVNVRRGYGFVAGSLRFISPDHDELAAQRA